MRIITQSITAYTSINVNQERTSWSSGTTYAQGDISTRNFKTYVSTVSSNTNHDPELDEGYWFNCGVDNKFASIDLDSSDSTYCNASTITSGTAYDLSIEIPTTAHDWVVIVGAEGSALTIVEKDALDATVNTINVSIDETQQSPSVNHAFQPHASATKAVITVTEKTTGGYSAIKYLIGGTETVFGEALYSPSFGLGGDAEVYLSPNGITYIDKDQEGDTLSADVVFDSSSIMTARRDAKYFKYVKAGFVFDYGSSSQYENLCLCGYMTEFDIVLRNPVKTFASAEIKEL